MPAQLSEDGLTIVCVFSDGRRRHYSIVGVTPRPLARDLLAALAGMIHPHGTVDAPATANVISTGCGICARSPPRAGFAGARRC